MKPDLLLVDEPTSALDNIIAYDVMKLLIKFLDSCAILLITHDLDMAKWCSDKIIRLEEENAKKIKRALVLLNMGGARNKDELKMFLTNMFNDRNILTVKVIY